jgi:C-terminal domain of apextrin
MKPWLIYISLVILVLTGSSCQVSDEDPVVSQDMDEYGAPLKSSTSPDLKTNPAIVELTPMDVDSDYRERTRRERNAIKASDTEEGIRRLLGVLFSAQQSSSAYHFRAEVGCCFDEYYWYLQTPSGAVQYLGMTTGFGALVSFVLPLNALAGGYRILLDAYIWDIARQQWIYFDYESGLANVPILTQTPDVGVIAGSGGCGPSQQVHFHMDNEDRNHSSNVTGWTGKTSVDGNGNTNFYFCRVSGYSFSSLQNTSSARSNYAVLQLGASCPPGSRPFARYFDNENNQNRNNWTGNVSPNTNIGDTTMNFCLFNGVGSVAGGLPALSFEYGVFAGPSFGFTDATGRMYTDDEDGSNRNGYAVDPAWASAAKAIVSEGSNTGLLTARRMQPSCPDGRCNGVETASSCRQDCGYCGDGVCFGNETQYSCNDDCGQCGDGICSSTDPWNCPGDCGTCGDGIPCNSAAAL